MCSKTEDHCSYISKSTTDTIVANIVLNYCGKDIVRSSRFGASICKSDGCDLTKAWYYASLPFTVERQRIWFHAFLPEMPLPTSYCVQPHSCHWCDSTLCTVAAVFLSMRRHHKKGYGGCIGKGRARIPYQKNPLDNKSTLKHKVHSI